MKLGLLIIGCITLLASTVNAATSKFNFSYTSLKEEDCQTSLYDEDFYQADCPSKDNYSLQVFGRDLRYGASLIYGSHEVNYEPIPPFHVGHTAEWRYEKIGDSKKYHALIYRIYTAQNDPLEGDAFFLPRDQDKQQLIVIRLNKEQSCLLGVIEQDRNMNQEARKLADNKSARCSK